MKVFIVYQQAAPMDRMIKIFLHEDTAERYAKKHDWHYVESEEVDESK